MELRALQSAVYRPIAEADLTQLPPRHHAVLSLGEFCHRLISNARGQIATHEVAKCTLVGHNADGEAWGRARGAQFVPVRRPKARKRLQPAVAASSFDPFK